MPRYWGHRVFALHVHGRQVFMERQVCEGCQKTLGTNAGALEGQVRQIS